MRDPVHDLTARAADPFPAVAVKRYRFLTLFDQAFVHNIEHLKKGHVVADVVSLVRDELPFVTCPLLTPDE
jgi:hypothetical protein